MVAVTHDEDASLTPDTRDYSAVYSMRSFSHLTSLPTSVDAESTLRLLSPTTDVVLSLLLRGPDDFAMSQDLMTDCDHCVVIGCDDRTRRRCSPASFGL